MPPLKEKRLQEVKMYAIKQTIIDLKKNDKSTIYLKNKKGDTITFKNKKSSSILLVRYLYRMEKDMEKNKIGFIRAYHTFESARYNCVLPDGSKRIMIVSVCSY